MIQVALHDLTTKIDTFGGLGRVHESGDETVLELLETASEMMSGYCELIDRHVDSVKKVYRSKKKRRKGQAAPSKATGSTPAMPTAGSLRERMLSFGSQPGGQQPFAWLRDSSQGEQQAPDRLQQSSFPSAGDPSSSLSKLTSLSSTLGSLGSLTGMHATANADTGATL